MSRTNHPRPVGGFHRAPRHRGYGRPISAHKAGVRSRSWRSRHADQHCADVAEKRSAMREVRAELTVTWGDALTGPVIVPRFVITYGEVAA